MPLITRRRPIKTLSPEEIAKMLHTQQMKSAAGQLQALNTQRELQLKQEANKAKKAVRVTPQNIYLAGLISTAAAYSYKNLQEPNTRLLTYNSDIDILLEGIKQDLPKIITEVINNVIKKVKQPIKPKPIYYLASEEEEEPIYANFLSPNLAAI